VISHHKASSHPTKASSAPQGGVHATHGRQPAAMRGNGSPDISLVGTTAHEHRIECPTPTCMSENGRGAYLHGIRGPHQPLTSIRRSAVGALVLKMVSGQQIFDDAPLVDFRRRCAFPARGSVPPGRALLTAGSSTHGEVHRISPAPLRDGSCGKTNAPHRAFGLRGTRHSNKKPTVPRRRGADPRSVGGVLRRRADRACRPSGH
jgi:hypothetical protein